MGRGVSVMPIAYGFPPYGLFGSVKAIRARSRAQPRVLAGNVVRVLLRATATAASLNDAIVVRLSRASSYAQANDLSRILAQHAPLPTVERMELLRKSEVENSQLTGAHDFDGHV